VNHRSGGETCSKVAERSSAWYRKSDGQESPCTGPEGLRVVQTTLVKAPRRYGDLIARAVRICYAADVMDMNGHVSTRDSDDPNVMWINSRKASRSTLTAADVGPLDITTGLRIGEGDEPPSEYHIHTEIYKRRPEIRSIVHSHPEHILALSIVGQPLRHVTCVNPFLPAAGAPTFDSSVLINTQARGGAVAEQLGSANAIVLRQHGTVVCGVSLEEAVVRMITAELNAKLQVETLQMGTPRYLEGEELAVLARENTSAVIIRKFWHFHEETARTMGALDGLA
jgi:ribulose-5-phosphate 4-epimerase/fuculose-1-phosphate aldolase